MIIGQKVHNNDRISHLSASLQEAGCWTLASPWVMLPSLSLVHVPQSLHAAEHHSPSAASPPSYHLAAPEDKRNAVINKEDNCTTHHKY